MMFSENSWFPSSLQAVELVESVLGKGNVVDNVSGLFSAHPVWDFLHEETFDPTPHIPFLRPRLESIGWQVVITASRIRLHDVEYPCFTVAPMLRVDNLPETVFHVTLKSRYDSIMSQGLLPSTAGRAHTRFPDVEAKIHVSQRLETADGGGDGAALWMREFPKKLGGSISDYGIIRVDTRGLPTGTRTYRDTHSHWGVVFDSLDRIEPRYLLPMADCDVEDLLTRCQPYTVNVE